MTLSEMVGIHPIQKQSESDHHRFTPLHLGRELLDIADSVFPPLNGIDIPTGMEVVENSSIAQPPMRPGSYRQISVSYTHLRAHETRHDLVCRLLLEKKKE